MKKFEKSKVVLTVISLFMVLAASSQALASKKGRPLSKEEIAVAWSGLTRDELEIHRIELVVTGEGSGGFVHRGREPVFFRIDSWSLRGSKIELAVTFLDEEEPHFDTRVFGEIVGNRMTLTLEGPDWKSKVNLRREQDILPFWNQLVEGMKN
jgi:hypothetical protein